MFDAIFVFVIIATWMCTHVAITTAEISSYVHVCGRNDPNYNQCITDNVLNLKDKLCKGFPEFDFPSIEPLLFGRVPVIDEPNIKMHTSDSKLYGICDFLLHSIHVDPDRRQFNLNLTLKQINVDTAYDFEVRLFVPIFHKGMLFITSDNVDVNISLVLDVITKNGKNHVYASKANTIVNITDYRYKFIENGKELMQLHRIFSNIIDNNKNIILDAVNPEIGRKISKVTIELFNNITQYNYEEFFPEKVLLKTLQ